MKKLTNGLISISLLSGAFVGVQAVEAAEGAKPGVPATYPGTGQVTFIENTESVVPVDPIDPSIPVLPIDPIDPEKPIAPGTSGPLSLDYASSFNFGTQMITSRDKTYTANPQVVVIDGVSSKKPLYVQVTDNRGTLEGWTLEVMQGGQFKTANNKELNGAEIVLTDGQHATVSETIAPTVVSDIVLSPTGAKSSLMSATQGQGSGTHIFRMGDLATMAEAVKLNVPGKTEKVKETYSTTLTWVLSTLP